MVSKINFDGADLSGKNMREANLQGASFECADLSDCDMLSANLRGADFTNASLANADLRNADLTDARFNGADLTKCDIDLAALRTADLTAIRDDLYAFFACIDECDARWLADEIKRGKYQGSGTIVGTFSRKGWGSYDWVRHTPRIAERWLVAIELGDSPSNSAVAAITVAWIEAWLAR